MSGGRDQVRLTADIDFLPPLRNAGQSFQCASGDFAEPLQLGQSQSRSEWQSISDMCNTN
jgi:hypothetical protein